MSAVRHLLPVRLALVAVTSAALALASCGGDSDGSSDDTATTSTGPAISAATNTQVRPTTGSRPPVATTTIAVESSTVPTTVAVETSTVPTTVAPPLVAGLPAISLLAPEPAARASTPLFEWQAIDGAATYRLVVTGPAGPIWAWEGSRTAVRLGGLAGERPGSFGGPRLVDGASWSVVALDIAGALVASSPIRMIGPA